MKWSLGFVLCSVLACAVPTAQAIMPPGQPELPSFDIRTSLQQRALGRTPEQQRAASLLQERGPDIHIDFDELLGTPKFVRSDHGFLTGPRGEGRAVPAETARRVPADDPHRALKNFLDEYAALFGGGADVFADARTNRDFVAAHNGMRTVVWQQQVDDIPVFEAVLVAHTTGNGELVNVSSRFLPDARRAADLGMPNRATDQTVPPISAPQAIVLAAGAVGEALDAAAVSAVDPAPAGAEKHQRFRAAVLRGNTDARLVWLPLDRTRMRLCWEIILTSRARGEMFRVLIDARTGEVMLRHGLTDYISDATYRVLTSDSPSPSSPGCATPCTNQPSLVSRSLVVLSALDTNASPNGWINDGDNTTLGNNADAHLDRNGDDVPDPGSRPPGSPFRTFDFAQDLTQDPVTYTNAAVVQLFYWNNWMHDKLYKLGFTEAAGNFQTDNFGRGGLGSDAVQADAQDGSGTDNANFSTPPDGSAPRMQMFIFTGPTPHRDGALDAEAILHEYTHGLSNRRVGGGVGLSALQSAGMGEGWSDFYALSLLSEPGDDVDAAYAFGGYVGYLLGGLTQNYYFGIRRYPYTTNLTKNPLTFKDIDPAQASSHPGIPNSPIIGGSADEVHNMGEVWCVTLWEARANLIKKYGFAAGNQLILQLVTDGMNLSPANPNFLQARDAILQADQVDTGGANRSELWAAFAKRGLGFSASSPSSSTTTGLVEVYDFPPLLSVTPSVGLISSGSIGGPFYPSSQVYALTNQGSAGLSWTAGHGQSWVSLSATSGTLLAGASTNITVSINASADGLAVGSYSDTVTFTNSTNGIGTTNRAVSLTVSPPVWPQWQLDHFGCTNCPQAAATADPDSDGQNNLTEFLAGTDPTSSSSFWRIQGSPTNGLEPLTVSFTDNSTGSSITNRSWSFGDGGIGSGSNPPHTYTNAGTFSVGLTIFNLYGTETLVASNLITVSSVAIWTNVHVSGNWSEASSWNPVGTPDHGCSVIFGTAGVTAMVDTVSRTVSNITFSRAGNFSVSPSGGAALSINNGITVTTNFTYTMASPVVLGGTNTWSVTSNGILQVSGPVSGTNSIIKTGSGTLILSGTNTYSGRTTVSNGTLQVTGSGLLTNTPSIDIANGATLDPSGRTGGRMTLVAGQTLMGGGTVRGNLTLAGGSTLSPGGIAVGTLTFLNDLVVSNAAVVRYDLGTNSDLTAVSSNLTLGGTLTVNDAGGFAAGVYMLFTYGGTLTCNGSTVGTVPPGYACTIDTNTAGQVKLDVVLLSAAIGIAAADLQDRLGNLAPTGSVAVLVVDTGNNGFVDPQPEFLLSVGAHWGIDNKVVGLWDLSACECGDGYLYDQTVTVYTDGMAAGQTLQLYWFPSLTLASNTVGIADYGKYTDTNSPPLDGSDAWKLPAAGSGVSLRFCTAVWGCSNPETAGRATWSTLVPARAGFTAGPTNGVAPLAVAFTDTSTGTITNRFWDFGNGSTSNTTATSLEQTYSPGTYTVTLVVSGPGGVSTNTRFNAISVLTPLAAWQQRYFSCTNCPPAEEDVDPDGDGQNNRAEFLAGTDPTNSTSAFRILGVTAEGDDVRIIWMTAGGRTNAVQAAVVDANGGYSTNFTDISGQIVIPGNADTTTNHLDSGGATNIPARFYRIRLVP